MGVMRLCLLLFCFFLATVSSVKRLNNTDDLKNTGYAWSVPRTGRQLLFWLSLQLCVNQNNKLNVNFDPSADDYGFHWFQNRERILPPLCSGQSYYEVGNLNPKNPATRQLPEYTQQYYPNYNVPEKNMDRLIVSVDKGSTGRISRVFVTAHNRNQKSFNSSDTYEIDPDLIREIRQKYMYNCSANSEDERCNQFLNKTGYKNRRSRGRMTCSPNSLCDFIEGIELQIKPTSQGYAKVTWENIPADIMKKYKFVYIYIYQNIYSKDSEDPKEVKIKRIQIYNIFGALDTSVSINAGLQPRLCLYKSYLSYFFSPVIWNGPEFDGANRVLPIRIKGCDASLQLYAKDGKASARLYIKKTFSDWNNVFYYSWVGFYKSFQKNNNEYYTYQYVVSFGMIDNTTIENYDIYQYDSSLTIDPGVQIRFLLDKSYDKVLAQTTPWGGDETAKSTCIGNPDPSSSWSFPEFFNEPELYDANNVVPVKIKGYDAGLQLFTKDGKVCARLYIKKSFGNWKNDFYYSWVGFYSNSQKKNTSYQTYQWAVYFKKTDDTENFHIYQYKSSLTIAPGVQIRFFKDKRYDHKLVETEPWSN